MSSHPALLLMIRMGSAASASFPHLSKAMTNPGCVLASRDITLLMKAHVVKAMFFPVVMYDVKVGPSGRLSTTELMLLNCGVRGGLRVPWTARRSNPSILKETSPKYSLEGLMLKLKLQYFGLLMQRP